MCIIISTSYYLNAKKNESSPPTNSFVNRIVGSVLCIVRGLNRKLLTAWCFLSPLSLCDSPSQLTARPLLPFISSILLPSLCRFWELLVLSCCVTAFYLKHGFLLTYHLSVHTFTSWGAHPWIMKVTPTSFYRNGEVNNLVVSMRWDSVSASRRACPRDVLSESWPSLCTGDTVVH